MANTSAPDIMEVPAPDDPLIYQKWILQHLGFRWSDKNFYPPDQQNRLRIYLDATWGSEFELARDEDKVDYSKSPIFIQMQKYCMDILNGITCDCEMGDVKCNTMNCKLRQHEIECSDKCKGPCANKRIQNDMFSDCVTLKCRDLLGICLVASSEIKPETFVIEYTGIVCEGKLHQYESFCYPIQKIKRKQETDEGVIINKYYINSFKYGSQSRYIKHHAQPNCKVQEWIVKDEIRIIIVAIKTIAADEVITINYPHFDPMKSKKPITPNEMTHRDYLEELHAKAIKNSHGKSNLNISPGLVLRNDEEKVLESVSDLSFIPIYRCKYNTEDKTIEDEGYSPCNAEFSKLIDFKHHVFENHESDHFCRFRGCGKVFTDENAKIMHHVEMHYAKVWNVPEGNRTDSFLPYFEKRKRHGPSRKGPIPTDKKDDQATQDILIYHPDMEFIGAFSLEDRSRMLADKQDHIELESFRKVAKTQVDIANMKRIEEIIKVQQKYFATKAIQNAKKYIWEHEAKLKKQYDNERNKN